MNDNFTSPRGYLSARAMGNRSPVVTLECGGNLLTTGYKQWNVNDIREYLLYSVGGQTLDSLLQAFLFSPNRARSNRFINPLLAGFESPTNKEDWLEWLDELFSTHINLHALEQAVEAAGPLCPNVDVWVTLPYPETTQAAFGMIDGQVMDFQNQCDRSKALHWWIDEFVARWNGHSQSRVLFRGFCWARGVILEPDLDLVKAMADVVHRHGLQFMFKTHYGSAHTVDWSDLGFNLEVLHPNYYGNTSYGREWIDNAANFAKVSHAGLVLSYGRGMLYDENHIYDYLNRGLPEYMGYMNEAFIVFDFDGIEFPELHEVNLPLYIAIYSFVKGIYRKRDYPGIPY